MQGLLKNVCTGVKVASPVGTGIGSSRSLVCGIVANGPKSLLIREAWELMKSAISSLRPITPGHKRLHSTASQGAASVGTLPPPLLLSPRGHPCLWSLLTLGSLWLVGTCFMPGKAVVSFVVSWAAVFQILCPCLVQTTSLHEACLPRLVFPAIGGRWMRCKLDGADLQTRYSEEKFSGTAGTNTDFR